MADKLFPSRGIPSKYSLYMPASSGREICEKGGIGKAQNWDLDAVIDFVFPRKYQPRYNEMAVKFLRALLEVPSMSRKDVLGFVNSNNYSKATLDNRIIPKLVRMGLVERKRITASDGTVETPISASSGFTEYLEKIAFEWQLLLGKSKKG
jgi:hypothetical protein